MNREGRSTMPNADAAAPVEPGQVWLRKRASAALVRRVRAVEGDLVHYEVLHGPAALRRNPLGSCRLRSFVRHSRRIEEQENYSRLDGADLHDTFLVLSTAGEPLLRCSHKRARFYLRKGHAREVSDGVLQFTDASTEATLSVLYQGQFSEFFLAVKNDRCVCCGAAGPLSRHHVVPKRHKRTVPLPWRNCLSNVLFVCLDCHEKYERTPEPDPDAADWKQYVHAWRDHFVRVMEPRFMPAGWEIVSVTNLDAVARAETRDA